MFRKHGNFVNNQLHRSKKHTLTLAFLRPLAPINQHTENAFDNLHWFLCCCLGVFFFFFWVFEQKIVLFWVFVSLLFEMLFSLTRLIGRNMRGCNYFIFRLFCFCFAIILFECRKSFRITFELRNLELKLVRLLFAFKFKHLNFSALFCECYLWFCCCRCRYCCLHFRAYLLLLLLLRCSL